MNTIAVIPSLNRLVSLGRLLGSLDCRAKISFEKHPRSLSVLWNALFRYAYTSGADIVIALADHIEATCSLSEVVQDAFEEQFPDTDGVVGLNLENIEQIPGQTEYCFLAVGRKFLERFPNQSPCCHDYYHFFIDTELGEYATSVGKFFWCEEARIVTHLHGGDESKALADPTHQASRRYAREDEEMRRIRQERGHLWGKNFDLIGRQEKYS